ASPPENFEKPCVHDPSGAALSAVVAVQSWENSGISMELSFGDFRLNPVDGLRRGARELHVTPKSLSVLYVLANHGGAGVSKDELITAVWPGVAISDSALASCIKELRRALGDDARQPRFIETLNRRGFRFLAPVSPAAARQA